MSTVSVPNIRHGRKIACMTLLQWARQSLNEHDTWLARFYLACYRSMYAKAPASTKRRWKSGH